VTIIKTECDHTIGGYTSQHWHSKYEWIVDADAWIFNITHPVPLTVLDPTHAIYGQANV